MADIEEKVKTILVNIRTRREYLGYSQEYVSMKLNISQNAYSKMELGKSEMNIKRLFSLADVLLTTPEKLIQDNESKETRSINWFTKHQP